MKFIVFSVVLVCAWIGFSEAKCKTGCDLAGIYRGVKKELKNMMKPFSKDATVKAAIKEMRAIEKIEKGAFKVKENKCIDGTGAGITDQVCTDLVTALKSFSKYRGSAAVCTQFDVLTSLNSMVDSATGYLKIRTNHASKFDDSFATSVTQFTGAMASGATAQGTAAAMTAIVTAIKDAQTNGLTVA